MTDKVDFMWGIGESERGIKYVRQDPDLRNWLIGDAIR